MSQIVLQTFLALLVTGSMAGVGKLNFQEEQDVLALFHRACSNQHHDKYGPGAGDNGMSIFCKSAKEDYEETLNHQVVVPPGPQRPPSIVFISQPAVR